MRRLLLAASLLSPAGAQAQTSPNWPFGYVPTAKEWNNLWASKADVGTGLAPSGAVLVTPTAPPQNLTYASGGLTDGVLLSPGRNGISYCPILSCVTSPSADHQRTSALFWSTTADDAHSEEQTVAVETIVNKGFTKTWTPGTAYALGDAVSFPAANTVYRATQGGISAASGTGPTGTGSGITDGTVVWAWINASVIAAKLGIYNEMLVLPGGGKAEALVNNFLLQPGTVPVFAVNTEMDFTNNSGLDCVPGQAACQGLQIFMGGTNYATAAIAIAPNTIIGGGVVPSLFGIFINGPVNRNADLEIDGTGSQVGLAFGRFVSASHTTATMLDATTGPVGLLFTGTKTSADLTIQTSSPAGIVNTGTHSLASILDNSASPTAISLAGTHSQQVIADNSTSGSALNAAGTYSFAALSTQNATTGVGLQMAAGQRLNFNGIYNGVSYNATNGKYYFTNSGNTIIASLDNSGNFRTLGTVQGSVAP